MVILVGVDSILVQYVDCTGRQVCGFAIHARDAAKSHGRQQVSNFDLWRDESKNDRLADVP